MTLAFVSSGDLNLPASPLWRVGSRAGWAADTPASFYPPSSYQVHSSRCWVHASHLHWSPGLPLEELVMFPFPVYTIPCARLRVIICSENFDMVSSHRRGSFHHVTIRPGCQQRRGDVTGPLPSHGPLFLCTACPSAHNKGSWLLFIRLEMNPNRLFMGKKGDLWSRWLLILKPLEHLGKVLFRKHGFRHPFLEILACGLGIGVVHSSSVKILRYGQGGSHHIRLS